MFFFNDYSHYNKGTGALNPDYLLIIITYIAIADPSSNHSIMQHRNIGAIRVRTHVHACICTSASATRKELIKPNLQDHLHPVDTRTDGPTPDKPMYFVVDTII